MSDIDIVLEHLKLANSALIDVGKKLQMHHPGSVQKCVAVQTKLVDTLQTMMESFPTEVFYRASLETVATDFYHIEERFFTTKEEAEKWAHFYSSSFTVESKYVVDLCKGLLCDQIYVILNPKHYTIITKEMVYGTK